MTIRHAVATFGVVAAVALATPAQDPQPPAKAPAPDPVYGASAALARGATLANVVPGSFRAQLVVDNRFPPKVKPPKDDTDRDPRDRTGKIHCLVCEYGLSPVVAVFVRGDLKYDADSNPAKLLKEINLLIPKYRSDKLAAFAMYLKCEGGPKLVTVKGPDGDEKVEAAKEYPDDEKRDQYAKEITDFAGLVGANNIPFGLAPTTSPSLTAFGLEKNDPDEKVITVIIYKGMRVARRWEFKPDDLNNDRIKEIINATEEMITGKTEKPKEKEKEKTKD